MKKFGINGFGRIGRTAFRAWYEKYKDQVDLTMINTSGSMDIYSWVHLLKYDTNYGVFDIDIKVEEKQNNKQTTDEDPVLGYIYIDDKKIVVTAQRDPSKIPWDLGPVDIVIESTGVFRTKEKASMHLHSGVKKVLISAPAKGEVSTSVISVNEFDKNQAILSNASCTTNSIAPVINVIKDTLGIQKAIMTTIHSYTDDQNLQDNSHRKDLRRARSAARNIIPTTTGAAIATTQIIPELKGYFDGMAVRVPTSVGSLSDITILTKRNTTVEEVNNILIEASNSPRYKGIIGISKDPIVSSDIVGRHESTIVDTLMTKVVDGNLVKIVTWYDNEWGYCSRLVEQITKINID